MKLATLFFLLICAVGCGGPSDSAVRRADGISEVTCYTKQPDGSVTKALTISDATVVWELQKDAHYRITRKGGEVVEIKANCYTH
jgi:hypothetical protein